VIALYAVLVAAAAFVPIPIVDDLLPQQLVRQLIRTILRQTGRHYSTASVKPLFAGDGCLATVFGILIKLPIDILLYPIRKFVRVIKGIRALSQRLVSTYLLGHTVSRYVAKDWLAEQCDAPTRLFQARVLRKAFDNALKQTNPVVFSGSVAAILGGVQGLPRAAWKTARDLLRRQAQPVDSEDAPAATAPPEARVDGATRGVERALEEPEVQDFLGDFDNVVDQEVLKLLAAASAGEGGGPRAPASTSPDMGS
jgi:hypothetical protein